MNTNSALPKIPYSVYERLTQDEMSECVDFVFKVAERLLKECDEQTRRRAKNWLAELNTRFAQYSLSEENFELLDSAIKDVVIGDFIKEIHYVFFSSAGNTENFINKLVQNLCDALCLDGPDQEYSALYDEAREILPVAVFRRTKDLPWYEKIIGYFLGYKQPYFSLFVFLRNNTWIVIILLLKLCEFDSLVETDRIDY